MDVKDYPKRPDISLDALDPNTSLALIARLVGHRRRVLDVGCASGYQARLLAENDCKTTGIEVNEQAAHLAREVCEQVHIADIERSRVSEIVAGESYDVVVFGDVLEHLVNPLAVLEDVRNVLSPNGVVVASIPNIAHGAIRLALLRGDFDYQPLGILDDTHVRFFTHKTLLELFAKAGFRIEELERTIVEIFSGSDLLPTLAPSEFSPDVIQRIEADPESRTLQFVFRARPFRNDANAQVLALLETIAGLRSRISQLESERRDLAQGDTSRNDESSAASRADRIASLADRFRTFENITQNEDTT